MDVSILIDADRHELAAAGLQLAHFAQARGADVRVVHRPTGASLAGTRAGFDRNFVRHGRYAKGGVLVCAAPLPSPDTVRAWNSMGLRTVLLAEASEPHDVLSRCLHCFKSVIAPSRVAAKMLSRYTRRVVACPWHVPRVAIAAKRPGGRTRLYVPAYQGMAVRISGLAEVVSTALDGNDAEALIELAERPGWPRKRVEAGLAALGLADRTRVVAPFSYGHRLAAMAASDLTLDVVPGRPLPMATLMSLAVGTPVASFRVAPFTELVEHEANGIAVPYKGELDMVRPRDCSNLASRVAAALADDAALRSMQSAASDGTNTRSDAFSAAIVRALGSPSLD